MRASRAVRQLVRTEAVPYKEIWAVRLEGLTSYNKGLELQHQVVQAQRADPALPAVALFLEHSPVMSVGNSGCDGDLLLDEAKLASLHVDVQHTDRGGQVTYHGPGQLVVYPVVDLRRAAKPCDIGWYVDALVGTVARTAQHYGVGGAGKNDEGIGVWLQDSPEAHPRKLAAIGAKLSRWTTTHGFAFNVNTNLRAFDLIVPCGIKGCDVTSLAREMGLQGHQPGDHMGRQPGDPLGARETDFRGALPGLDMENVIATAVEALAGELGLGGGCVTHMVEEELRGRLQRSLRDAGGA